MKKFGLWMMAAILTCGTTSLKAQNNMAGREYHNPNIMKDMIEKAFDDADVKKKLDNAVVDAEKEKGRKLTAEEKAEVEKNTQKAIEMMDAMKKGLSTAITLTFKDDKNLVMKTDMKMDDDILKKAGISWAKRKAMKLALAIMPAEKATYHTEGDMIIVEDEKEPDTMRISADGKYIYGKMDEKTKFTLTRTK